MAESTSWVVEFTEENGVLVFSSDSECEIYLGIYAGNWLPIEWYMGDASSSGVISMGLKKGTVEIFSKSNATAMFTACYLGNSGKAGEYWEIRPFSSGADEVDKMSQNTRLGFVVVGPNVTVSTEWIQEPPSGLSMFAYGRDSEISLQENKTFLPGDVWMLDMFSQKKITSMQFNVSFTGGRDVEFSKISFAKAGNSFGMFTGNSFVEFTRVWGVPAPGANPRLGTTWPCFTSLVLFLLIALGVFAVSPIRDMLSNHQIVKEAK